MGYGFYQNNSPFLVIDTQDGFAGLMLNVIASYLKWNLLFIIRGTRGYSDVNVFVKVIETCRLHLNSLIQKPAGCTRS